MSVDGDGFVSWEEQVVSQERGSRVVHYFLKDSSGGSVLAVVGTERSVRHMTYVVSDVFMEKYGATCGVNTWTKWRARREVLDWLKLQVSKRPSWLDSWADDIMQPNGQVAHGINTQQTIEQQDLAWRKLRVQSSHIGWSGSAWICCKQLTHYPAFRQNGTNISVHSFVLIMASEGSPYIGYLEDMYEDKKGRKKVKVRWFHRGEELAGMLPQLNAHSREVLITPHVQVIKAECIGGPVAVLTPKHYEQCLSVVPPSFLSRLHLCFRQFKDNVVKPFSLSKLRGYSNQGVLSCLDNPLLSKHISKWCKLDEGVKVDLPPVDNVRQGTKRPRICNYQITESCPNVKPPSLKLRFKLSGKAVIDGKHAEKERQLSSSFKVDDKIELLCQDSGLRNCWFRCTVLQVSQKRMRVLYDDVQDAEEPGNLEECVPASRVATPDKLGLRCRDRLTIRPRPPKSHLEGTVEVGTAVEAWWCDGWWEGVVSAPDFPGEDSLQVYLTGDGRRVTVKKEDIRAARDWVDGVWVNISTKPDILAGISAIAIPSMKLPACSPLINATESGKTPLHDPAVPNDTRLEDANNADEEYLPAMATSSVADRTDLQNYFIKIRANFGRNSKHHNLDMETSIFKLPVAGKNGSVTADQPGAADPVRWQSSKVSAT